MGPGGVVGLEEERVLEGHDVTPREEAIRRMRAAYSASTRTEPATTPDPWSFPVTGPWSYRPTCEHHRFQKLDKNWKQCARCWWCKPRLGVPPKIEKLPAILRGRMLPPLNGKVDLRAMYANAGFVLSEDRLSVLSRIRIRIVQYSWCGTEIRRCGVEVRFKDIGWKEAAVCMETYLHRLFPVLRVARPRRPKQTWVMIQRAFGHNWKPPWEELT
jgi:hypothetical protein